VLLIVGTRPDAIKLAPVIREVARRHDLEGIVVSTGQHKEMLDQVLSLFGVAPDLDLGLMQPGQTLPDLTGRVLTGVTAAIERFRPQAVVIQGDTTTAMAAALAAFYARVPVVHVEAGLRSPTIEQPFPEEANRRLTAVLATQHLAPTPGARASLLRERVDPGNILVTGNTVIDALLWAVNIAVPPNDLIVRSLDEHDRRVVLVTAHRRESWGLPLFRVGLAAAEVARQNPEVLFVFPAHRNPLVRESLITPLEGVENALVTEPLDYHSFCRLLLRSHVVVTDSGGVQEEAPSLGRPVLVLRDVTERPEGVAAGAAKLVGTRYQAIVDALDELLHDDSVYRQMANVTNPYGDGQAAERTAGAIGHLLGRGSMPTPFRPTPNVNSPHRHRNEMSTEMTGAPK
jgi:UDP-N-acetylglucosamine 2-epimerase (non-hydrolysing)